MIWGSSAVSPGAPQRGRTLSLSPSFRLPLLLIVLVGVALRIAPWLRPNVFLGVQEYDDGVYYGAARALLHGLLPYRDFTIVHPPGSAVLLLPFAALGSVLGDPVGLAGARVAIAVVAVVNLLLVYRLAQFLPTAPSRARIVPLLAAAVYAVLPNVVQAEHTVLLEPLVNVLCLSATLLLQRGRRGVALAGALCAVALSVKLFAAVYVLALLGWLLLTRRRQVLPYLAGLTAGLAVLVLPFAALAPERFWHNVVVTQLSRPLDSPVSGLHRLADLVGLGALPAALPLVVVLVLVAALRARQDWRTPVTLWLAVGLGSAVAFLASASYFPHYGAFLAPPLALVLAGAVARPPARLQSVSVIILLAVLAGSSVLAEARTHGQADLRRVAGLVPAGSCVFSENASTALAVGLFAAPSARCPGWIDGRGVSYDGNTDWPRDRNFYFAGFTGDARWQAELQHQFARADFLLLTGPPAQLPEWSAATRAYAETHFRLVLDLPAPGRGSAQVWRRS